jgi:hypothetical protein
MVVVIIIVLVIILLIVFIKAVTRDSSKESSSVTVRREDKGPDDHQFYSKIAGVTRKNSDGTSRQALLAKCEEGEVLRLVREPDNPHDSNAVKVLTVAGEQLGYITATAAETVAREMDRGHQVRALITDLTGGTADEPTRGCNIELTISEG